MSAHRFTFRTRWLGYDRAEVNRFLDQVAGDRQFLKDKLNYLESVVAKQGGSTDLSVPPRDDEATRAALQAQRLQLDRLKDLTREMATCLDDCISLLRKSHDLLAVQIGVPATLIMPEAPAKEDTSEPRPEEPAWARRLAYVGLALLAAGGGVVSRAPGFASHTSSSIVPGTVSAPLAAASAPADSVVSAAVVPDPSAPPQDQPLTADQGLSVILTARGMCWVRSVVDGSNVVERLMQPGESMLVWAREEVLLRAGDGAALELTINGHDPMPLGRAGQVVTRRITRENVKLLLQQQA